MATDRIANKPWLLALALALAALTFAGCSAISNMSMPSTPSWVNHLLYAISRRRGEYLFCIGAMYASLALLDRRRWIGASAVFFIAIGWLAFHLPLSLYLESLGVDSFAETKHFNLEEARFWFHTLRETLYPQLSLKKLLVYVVASLVGFYVLRRWLAARAISRRRATVVHFCLAALLVGLGIQYTTSKALAVYLDNSEKFLTTVRNFDQPVPEVRVLRDQPDLMVYIGESTSTMNMGLYGYPRPTTPRLSKRARTDANLIVFENVFATHAHTSRSLLEALSLGVDDDERFLPITQRRRVSIVDVLNQAGVASSLISNQGIGGSWDQASSVVFKNAHKLFRQKPAGANDAYLIEKVWDHEFFSEQLDLMQPPSQQRTAIFLHSYAGHGPYFGNIPERFRTPVDGLLGEPAAANAKAVKGVDGGVEEYDAAIKYVDYSVDQTLVRINQLARPVVFVYFSDHGDAAFRGLGHDSARFHHEMSRVPFLIYFNDAARKENPALYERYRQLARQKQPSTLAQLPATLMDVLGIELKDAKQNAVVLTPVIGQKAMLPPIMVRDTAEGTTFVNANDFALQPPEMPGRKLIDKTDDDTKTFAAVQSGRMSRAKACDDLPKSLEAVSRGIMVAGCPNRLLSKE